MSLYEKIKSAQDSKDIDMYLTCLHKDFVFVRHQSGTEVSKADWTPTVTQMMQSDALQFHDQRCLYENDEIMVEHSVMKFPDGTSEAVMVVNHIKDGKIIRVETGATPLK
ncbi:nuclear transport factor 2 family protein [Thalassobium sp. R2A62]|uniref:nuclear transport factor 2 family protein n=1 Tax=Thalassobium sp. R2A62 TaxID=633131 RepID=UPI0005929099|nr:nuclear transport factor 2 family protein [Thalassobium sp. R2A62]